MITSDWVARLSASPDGGQIDATKAAAVSIRPAHHIVKRLRAAGLSVELKRIGRHVVPIVTMERPHS